MAPQSKSRFWRTLRLYFRRFRILVWLAVLLLLGSLLYVNQIGLPGFIKNPLLARLRAHGIDLQFSRLRLRWYEGIVAEHVRFGRPDESLAARLEADEARVLLNLRALRHGRLRVDALELRQGRLSWPIPGTNAVLPDLAVEQIHTSLRFLPGDLWALDNFKATFAGANLVLSGIVTNASSIRDWKFLQAKADSAAPSRWPERVKRLSEIVETLHFSSPPELHLTLAGDARELQSFTVRFVLAAPGAQTPWGTFSNGRFTVRVFPARSNDLFQADLALEAADAQTRWAALTNLRLAIHLSSLDVQTNVVDGRLTLSASNAETQWGSGRNTLLSAEWVHSITNAVPLSGHARLYCESPRSPWGNAQTARFVTGFAVGAPASCDPAWGWWTNLQPYLLDWQCHLSGIDSPRLQADEATLGGSWRPPELVITNLEARLYGGNLFGRAQLNVATRDLQTTLRSTFDPHGLAPMLGEGGRHVLEQLSWDQPPVLEGRLSLLMPAWTNQQPDWRKEVQPTLQMEGQLDLPAGGAYREVQASAARVHFAYSNLCWHLPEVTITRSEGTLVAEHQANDETGDFHWRLSSSLDPRVLLPLLGTNAQRGFELFTFTVPPVVKTEMWGRSHEPERTGFKATVSLTNFTFRGEAVSSLRTAIAYTNRYLQFFQPRIERGAERLSADGLAADFNSELIYLTNGVGNADPMFVTRAIGPHVAKAIAPYQFDHPVTARVHGTIPMHGEEGADLHFDIAGGPFHWWKFNLPQIAGHIHWAGLQLDLTDVRTDFYQGQAIGSAHFDFVPHQDTEFRFSFTATNVLLQALMSDLSTRTNHLEGRVKGSVVVTHANTGSLQSVNGYGDVALRDGLIWDIPIFGIFSPVLNSVVPGLGNSRASAGTCSFVMTNGVIHSEDLEIRSTGMRLQYRGTVDFEGKVNARVEAELLRDMWVVGPVLSTVFWPVTKMFEYKVAGTLSEPKLDPVFIVPKIVLMPFHPVRTFKGLFPETPPAQTNAPPRLTPP